MFNMLKLITGILGLLLGLMLMFFERMAPSVTSPSAGTIIAVVSLFLIIRSIITSQRKSPGMSLGSPGAWITAGVFLFVILGFIMYSKMEHRKGRASLKNMKETMEATGGIMSPIDIIVASRALEKGTEIKDEDLAVITVPMSKHKFYIYAKDRPRLIGQKLKFNTTEQQIMRWTYVEPEKSSTPSSD